MREPVEEVRRAGAKERKLTERRELHPLAHHVDTAHERAQLLGGLGIARALAHQTAQPERDHQPAHAEEQLERAALVNPSVVVVARRDRRHHRLEARRTLGRGEPLRRAHVRGAESADVAVGPRLARDVLDRVVAIARLVDEAPKRPLRGEQPAAVLNHDVVASARGADHVERVEGDRREGLVVRRAVEQHRQFLGPVGPVEVGLQHASVTHRDVDIFLDDDPGHQMGSPCLYMDMSLCPDAAPASAVCAPALRRLRSLVVRRSRLFKSGASSETAARSRADVSKADEDTTRTKRWRWRRNDSAKSSGGASGAKSGSRHGLARLASTRKSADRDRRRPYWRSFAPL